MVGKISVLIYVGFQRIFKILTGTVRGYPVPNRQANAYEVTAVDGYQDGTTPVTLAELDLYLDNTSFAYAVF